MSYLTLHLPQVLASLLIIDYGTEWIKAPLMEPAVPFDVVKDSMRKIRSSVAWRNGDRIFGSEAYDLVSHQTCLVWTSRNKLRAGHRVPHGLIQYSGPGGVTSSPAAHGIHLLRPRP